MHLRSVATLFAAQVSRKAAKQTAKGLVVSKKKKVLRHACCVLLFLEESAQYQGRSNV